MQLNLAAIVALFGAISTLLASVLKDCSWPAQTKAYIALGTSIVMGIAATFASGVTDPGNIGLVITAVIGASQAYYAAITGPLGLDKAIANAIPSPFRAIASIFTHRAAKEQPVTKADVDAAVNQAVSLAVDRFSALLSTQHAAPTPTIEPMHTTPTVEAGPQI